MIRDNHHHRPHLGCDVCHTLLFAGNEGHNCVTIEQCSDETRLKLKSLDDNPEYEVRHSMHGSLELHDTLTAAGTTRSTQSVIGMRNCIDSYCCQPLPSAA